MKNPAVNEDSQVGRRNSSRLPGRLLDVSLEADLARLDADGLRRRLRRIEGAPGPYMRVDGVQVCMLASANYLDLAGDPRVLAGAREALEASGAAAGGARLISGNLPVHEALEHELARFLGCEAALLFSTGYMANLGVLTALCGPGDTIVSDALNHASIVDACRLSGASVRIFRHNDAGDLARVARDLPARGRRVLVIDGVFSMDGDVADLAALVPIARAHDMLVVLDDAHGIGVLGAGGRGTAEACGTPVDVWIGNLGKALGSFGAFVAGSATLREWLLNRARSFVFTCALAPSAAGAARAALRIVQQEPERRARLLERARALRDGLAAAGLHTGPGRTHIVPLVVGESEAALELCERALARGIFAQAIRYPSVPRGAARLRLTPSAAHSASDIERCSAVLCELSARRAARA